MAGSIHGAISQVSSWMRLRRCSISSVGGDVTSHVIQRWWSVDITSQGHLAIALNRPTDKIRIFVRAA
jgi:hypothetical protein